MTNFGFCSLYLDTFEEDPEECKVADCTKDLAEELCPKTCSEDKSCQIADCTKPKSTKLCPKTCAKRPKEDLGKNDRTNA